MLKEYSVSELVDKAGGGPIWRAVVKDQAEEDGSTPDILMADMQKALCVMRESAAAGFDEGLKSLSGMTGGQAAKYRKAVEEGRTAGGRTLGKAAARALAVAELNACMGRIVAAPTAGACGVVPGVLLTAAEEHGFSDEALVQALFTAAGIGKVIAGRASISGAQGGCQAEIGAAAAMAAAALVELMGGSPDMAAHAVALSIMNLMGLVCDPVRGLVEVPCVYRNVAGVAVALTSADMALAGIAPILPADEVIDASARVGQMMPAALKETGVGGCASCAAAKECPKP